MRVVPRPEDGQQTSMQRHNAA